MSYSKKKNPIARNSETIGVTTIKRKIDVYLNSEKPNGKCQVLLWNGVEKKNPENCYMHVL
jgi:hypothetical protein